VNVTTGLMLPELIAHADTEVKNPVEGPLAVTVHDESKELKPLPLMVTGVPLGPVGGVSDIWMGPGTPVTVNDAEAECALWSATVIV